MAHRHELSDDQWTLVEPLLSKASGKTGRPRRQPRAMLNGIFWILRTGAPWRDLPERYGPWQTVYQYFTGWRADGTVEAAAGRGRTMPLTAILWYSPRRVTHRRVLWDSAP